MARVRSPNYPQMSLPEAISRVGEVFAKEHTHLAPKEVIVQHLGYGGINGASLGALSALAKYGLLERQGEEYRVSDRALAILHPESAAEKSGALEDAARAPALFSELLDQFSGAPPSDENLRAFLIRRGYSQSALSAVIKSFRETMELVASAGGGYSSPSPTAKSVAVVHPVSFGSSSGAVTAPPSLVLPAAEPPKKLTENEFRVSLTDAGLEIKAGLVDQAGVDRLIAILQANKLLLPEKREEPARTALNPVETGTGSPAIAQ